MAKYNIDWSCGHHTVDQLYGKHTERERHIEWAERQGKCPDCFRAEKQAEREAANQQAAQNLPALVGSEKQIKWAEAIRRAALDAPGNHIVADADAKLATVPADKRAKFAAGLAAMRVARAQLESEISAKWWIEHRADIYPLESFVREAGIKADKEYVEVAHAAA